MNVSVASIRICDVPVRLFSLPGTLASGNVARISLLGALIETRAEVELGAQIFIELLRSGIDGRRSRVTAQVIRCMRGGVEVHWRVPLAGHRAYEYLETPPMRAAPLVARASPGIDGVYYYRFDFID
jgi:hypothetical protein